MKVSKAALAAAQQGDFKTVKKLKPKAQDSGKDEAKAFVKMAGSVENAVNDLAQMVLLQHQQYTEATAELRAENKLLKEGLLVMQHELKALRERAVRLKPVQNADGSYKHIDVVPLQKKNTLN